MALVGKGGVEYGLWPHNALGLYDDYRVRHYHA